MYTSFSAEIRLKMVIQANKTFKVILMTFFGILTSLFLLLINYFKINDVKSAKRYNILCRSMVKEKNYYIKSE